MPALEDVSAVTEALGWLQTHPDIVAVFGSSVSGVSEAPWPHLMVTRAPGGNLGDLRWSRTDEVQLEVHGHPDGGPGPAALERALLTAVRALGEITERDLAATDSVVSRVSSSGGIVDRPLPEGQPRLLTTLRLVVRPPLQ